jgi:hypothetical protein
MQYEEDILNAAFATGYEPRDGISREELLYEAREWITDLTR